MTLASKVIALARDEIGYTEKKSIAQLDSKTANAGSGNYTKYWRDVYPAFQGQPWCDCFVKAMFIKACGSVNAAKKALCQPGKEWSFYTPTSANYYRAADRFYATPKVGDQVFFKDAKGTICHTGIVEQVTNGSIVTIEGNTSGYTGVEANGGQVARKSYIKGYQRIAGYGRPIYEEVDMTEAQAKQLEAVYKEVTRKDDPTGRGKKYNDHDHLKWMAAKQALMDERQQAIEAKLDQLIELVGKN